MITMMLGLLPPSSSSHTNNKRTKIKLVHPVNPMGIIERRRSNWKLLGRSHVLVVVGGLTLFLANLWEVKVDLSPSAFASSSISPVFVQSNEHKLPRRNHTQIPVDDALRLLPPLPSAVGGTPRNHSIIYIHVGKTGGLTLDKVLHSNCIWYEGRSRRRKCLKALGDDGDGGGSRISDLSKATLHFGPRRDFNQWILNATMFLSTLRNPIARAVSSFNFDHPSNIDPRRYGNAMPDSLKHFYIECFPTVQYLADLLQQAEKDKDSLTEKQQTCYSTARRTLAGNGSELAASHLRMNYAFYNRLSMAQFPNRSLLVVRTEYLWDDVTRIDRMLGGNGYFARSGVAYTHGSQSHAVRQGLSNNGKQTVCCYLASEMQIYENLLRKAANLLAVEIGESLSEIYSECGLMDVPNYLNGDRAIKNGVDLAAGLDSGGSSFSWEEWASETCPLSTLLY